jgi:Fuc2NAc and GlcNAc transferase
VFQAHRLHLFQRLQRAGWSHQVVSLVYGCATALLAICRQSGWLAALVVVACGEVSLALWLDRRVAVPFAGAGDRA